MWQQWCGYNFYLDMVCYQCDGWVMFGLMLDFIFVDVFGGWYDVGDQLKYFIIGSYVIVYMFKVWELYLEVFVDKVNVYGQFGLNNILDVLDEVCWGLDWIYKLYFVFDQLFYQVVDDCDYWGWKMFDQDNFDYGWGVNSYWVVYFVMGELQGLWEYKSQVIGVVNLVGWSVVVMVMVVRFWLKVLVDSVYFDKCVQAVWLFYVLGWLKEGFQQGNFYGVFYCYSEDIWADDMEWGVVEFYCLIGEKVYLEEVKVYVWQVGIVFWMLLDMVVYYWYYFFVNMGYYVFYDLVDEVFQDMLVGYYCSGIEYMLEWV